MPLLLAIKKERVDVVELLLSHGAAPNVDLRVDVNDDIARFLLENGANPNTRDRSNVPSLVLAVFYPHCSEFIELLLEFEVDVNADGFTPFWCGSLFERPLLTAILRDEVDIVRLLLEKGADPNPQPTHYLAPPLVIAAQRNHLQLVEMLVRAGANVNAIETQGNHVSAISHAVCNKNLSMVLFLVRHGATMNSSLLCMAAARGNVAFVQSLVRLGSSADFDAVPTNNNPIVSAASTRRINVMKYLFDDIGVSVDVSTLYQLLTMTDASSILSLVLGMATIQRNSSLLL